MNKKYRPIKGLNDKPFEIAPRTLNYENKRQPQRSRSLVSPAEVDRIIWKGTILLVFLIVSLFTIWHLVSIEKRLPKKKQQPEVESSLHLKGVRYLDHYFRYGRTHDPHSIAACFYNVRIVAPFSKLTA